jgi:hypothetical protein
MMLLGRLKVQISTLSNDRGHCAGEVWLVGPAAGDLDKNNLALSQFLIVSQHLPNVKSPAINCTLDRYIGRHAKLENLAA